MTINNWLQNAIKKLESTSVPTARLDAEVLLADYLDKDRSWIHAYPDYELPDNTARSDPAEQGRTLQKLKEQIERRMTHEPLAYIRGKQEFYGRDFLVSPDTLTPRPETETMIDIFLDVMKNENLTTQHSPLTVLDVGTGSGCLAITLDLELSSISNLQSDVSILGLDISEPALKIAKKNAENLKAGVAFKKFDLLTDDFSLYTSPSTVLLANLPYVPDDFHINLAATHEPEFAIYGGSDGLDYYRAMFEKLPQNVDVVFTESLQPQQKKLTNIAEIHKFRLIDCKDLIQVFKRN